MGRAGGNYSSIANIQPHGYLGSNADGQGLGWLGLIDEFRSRNIPPSPDWITAEVNNQGAPGSFYSLAALAAAAVASSSALFFVV